MKITRSHEQWRTILNEQQTSGLTIIDYCREHQLATSSFYYGVTQLQQRTSILAQILRLRRKNTKAFLFTTRSSLIVNNIS